MSFRHNSTAILLCVVFSIFASCASSDHPVATSKQYPVNESSDSLPNDGNIEVGDIDFDELQVMVSDFPERALSDLDEWLAGYDSPRLHLLFGQASLNLLEQRQASGKLGPGLAADLFSDADAAFAKSLVNFDTHNASLRGMARSFCRQGQFVPAWSSALLWHSAEQHNFNLNDQLLFAEIGLGRVIAEQKKQAAETPAAHLAAEAFEAAIELGAPHSTRISLSDLHAWQQRPAAAAVELAAAISAAPDDPTAYQRLKSLCLDNRNLHTATLKQLCFELSDSASALWYYGEALYLQARDARAAADFIKGMSALDNAERAFEQAAILNEDFAQSCHDWISILKTLRAWLLRDDQRIDDAIASVLDVIEFNPIALQQPLLEESLPNVINYLISDIYQSGNLRKAISLLRSVCQVNDTIVLFVNNLGLFTRDLARTLSMNNQHQEAEQLYLESWDVYSRLVELMPEDPRSINDRALIAVYYLDDHHQFAVQELHRVIGIGEALLDEMDDNVPDSERRHIDEAVGDAYENLAYYQVFRLNQVGDADNLLNKSNTHYPFDEREGVIMIRKKLKQIRQ